MKPKYRKESNCVYYCAYHIVITTKYPRKILNEGIGMYLDKIMQEIRKFHPEIRVEGYNYDKNHIQILVIIPPKYSVGKVVGMIKANTSRLMKEKFSDFLKNVYWCKEGIWSGGCFVFTVEINE